MTPASELARYLAQSDWAGVKACLESPLNADTAYDRYFAWGLWHCFGSPQSDFNAGIDALEKARAIQPENPDCLNTLSQIYLQAGRPAMAFHLARQSTQTMPGNFRSQTALATAALACGEQNIANAAIAHAWELSASEAPALRAQLYAMTLKHAPFWTNPLLGKRVRLTRLVQQHKDFLAECRRNQQFIKKYHLFHKADEHSLMKDIKSAELSPLESAQVQWVVFQGEQPIGLAGLVDMDVNNLRAELLIGFPQTPPAGFALETALLIMEFAFDCLGLNKLISYVYADNPDAQLATLHLGFGAEGLLRQHVRDPHSDQAIDLHINGLLAADFFGSAQLNAYFRRLLARPCSTGGERYLQKTRRA